MVLSIRVARDKPLLDWNEPKKQGNVKCVRYIDYNSLKSHCVLKSILRRPCQNELNDFSYFEEGYFNTD